MDTYEVCAAEARRIGEDFAERLERRLAFRPLPLRKYLPLQGGYLPSGDAHAGKFFSPVTIFPTGSRMWRKRSSGCSRLLLIGEPAYRVKQLIDDRFRTANDRSLLEDGLGFSDEILRSRRVPVTVSALQLGDYTFVGVPGESLCDMSIWLRSQFTGVKTIPVDQVNGCYG